MNDDDSVAQQADIVELSEEDHRYRRLGILLVCAIAVSFCGVVAVNTFSGESLPSPSGASLRRTAGIPLPHAVLARLTIIDTVYTTDSIYLELNLTRQLVAVHFRDGALRRFRVSSGNPAIREGMATPVGIFTVQNQVPMALSRQFNNARLHHWIGIQGGVGFHGLDGSGYYGYLGVRSSSHGCVRMSREEIADMYKLVHPGALIMVHYGTPARVVAFCDVSDTLGAQIIDSAAVYDRSLGDDRLEALMSGEYWTSPRPRLVHIARQRLRWGLKIGDSRKVPHQTIPSENFAARFAETMPRLQPDHFAPDHDYLYGQDISYRDSLVAARRTAAAAADSADRTQVVYGE